MQLFHLPMSRKLSKDMFYALVAIILKIMAASTNLIGFISDPGISHGFHNEGHLNFFTLSESARCKTPTKLVNMMNITLAIMSTDLLQDSLRYINISYSLGVSLRLHIRYLDLQNEL